MKYKTEAQLVKIQLPTGLNSSFNSREKQMNTEIQKRIDLYNQQGYMVIEKTVINKSSNHATIKFVVQKLIR
jgi:hypothetical protein